MLGVKPISNTSRQEMSPRVKKVFRWYPGSHRFAGFQGRQGRKINDLARGTDLAQYLCVLSFQEVSALLRRPVSAGLFLALSVLAVTARGEASSRLEWQPEACRLSWHRNCSFAPGLGSAETSTSHRFVTLEARLRAFAPSDASLYAVFLTARKDLDALRASLHQAARPGLGRLVDRRSRPTRSSVGSAASGSPSCPTATSPSAWMRRIRPERTGWWW